MWPIVLLAVTSRVWSQTPPASPCPEVFQYLYRDGQWSGQIFVPVEGVDVFTLVASIYIAHVTPPVPGGLHTVSLETNDSGTSYVEFCLIFPVQSPVPLLDKITLNDNLICQGIPAKVRYVFEGSCEVRLLPALRGGELTDCHEQNIRWRSLDDVEELTSPDDVTGGKETTPSGPGPNSTMIVPRPPMKLQGLKVQISCSKSEQHVTLKGSGECGLPVGPVRTIYNGMLSARGDWPWLVALHLKPSRQFLCGGSLISKRHVITAAHCFTNPDTERPVPKKELMVLLGKFNLTAHEPGVQCRTIDKIIKYPEYSHQELDNDIAILILNAKVTFTEFVLPICLWKPGMTLPNPATGTVVGWGQEEMSMMISPTPRMALVPLVSQQMCKDSHHFYRNFVNERTLCAGNMDGTGPCWGDSGGGLVIPVARTGKKIRWYLRGIVSFNLKGNPTLCHLDEYSLYTDVAPFLGWIYETTARG